MMLDNTAASALESLGHFLLVHDRTEQARTLFEGLTALAPDRYYAYYGLAVLDERAGDPEGAATHWGAVTSRCSRRDVLLRNAEFLCRAGRHDESMGRLRSIAAGDDAAARRAQALLLATIASRAGPT